MKATGIILAGGKNSRMGENKAFLKVGKKKIIDRLVEKLKKDLEQVIIVTNERACYDYLEVDVISDIIPGMGPLSGIHAGLKNARYEHALVMACDMPFVEGELGLLLMEEATGFDVVVPQIGEHLQPLFAVYAKNCIKPIEDCLKNSIYKVAAFYPQVKVNYVSEEKIAALSDIEKVFINVNTPKDLERARSIECSREIG